MADVVELKPKKKRWQPRRVTPPTAAQVELLAGAMPTQMLQAYARVAAWSGLRLSEVAALEWRDVDLEAPGGVRLHVRKGKGGKERRSVLFPAGVQALTSVAPPGEHIGLVFHNPRYRPFNKQAINRPWVSARESVGLPHVWFHDLRKFHGTWLLDRGVSDLDVAVQLGHFDKWGRPDAGLVRLVYGFPNHDLALERVAGVGQLA